VVDEDTAEPLVWLDGPTTDELTDIGELVIGAADELVEDAAVTDEELENSAELDDETLLEDEELLDEAARLDDETLLEEGALLDEMLLDDATPLVDETLLVAALGSPQDPYSDWQPSPQKSILEPLQKR
jgi:hypothetical protein